MVDPTRAATTGGRSGRRRAELLRYAMADEGPADPAAIVRAHRWRLWAEVDRRPSLWTVGYRDPPHAEDCGCFSCGGWSFRTTHPDACLCRVCQPQRWKGNRHRRLLRFLATERQIYDAQRCAFGIYDLLPYVRRAGLDWLDAPERGELAACGAGEVLTAEPTGHRAS